MAIDDRDLLDVLKFELNFLEKGGYGSSPREPWRAPRIFEDSPRSVSRKSRLRTIVSSSKDSFYRRVWK